MTSAPERPVIHEDVATRAARGKARRRLVPRSALAVWEPAAARPDPAALLQAQERTRVPELVPLRHERMTASPFAFYRGAAAIMASDLAQGPRTDLWVQCCGDAHLANFGGFASPERSLVFDINDFDETSPGPFEWDVKRLATSFEIAGRSLELADEDRRDVVLRVSRAYREAIAKFAGMTNLAVWYAHLDLETVLARAERALPERAAVLRRSMTKARSKDSVKAAHKLTALVDGHLRFVSSPPELVALADLYREAERDELFEWLRDCLRGYRDSLPEPLRVLLERYRLVDFARKVVGVGSVGTRCWIALLLGRDNDDPLMLQIKQAEASVLEPYGGTPVPHHGKRVVNGQRLLQASSDIMLGWLSAVGVDGVGRDFYVRQLWDGKLSADIESMRPEGLAFYADMCGWTLARGHAVSGDPITISAYLGSQDRFETAMADFAAAYADQNQRDFDAVKAQAAAGLL